MPVFSERCKDCAGCQQVSAFSTWEKELHKIVFDPRYLLLTSKERKQVFEQYVKERAEEERREKRNKLKEKKELFRQLLEEAHVTSKYDLFSLTVLCICSVVTDAHSLQSWLILNMY